MNPFSLSVIIPAYNEKDRLPKTLDALLDFFKQASFDEEILICDDGSEDETFAIAQKYERLNPAVRALSLNHHMGKGSAVALGVREAQKKWILLYDADAATPMPEVHRFIEAIRSDSQVLIGSRDVPGSRRVIKQPWLRHKLGRLFVQFRKILVGLKEIEDTQCGFKMIRAPLAKKIFSNLNTAGFLFDVEILGRAEILGAPIQEIGVEWWHVPQSKVKLSRELPRILAELMQIRRSLKEFKTPSEN